MTIELWAAFAVASAVVLAIPGPTVLLVSFYALAAGRRAGWWMAGGVALGDFVAMTASVLGLGALLLSSAELFNALRWIGALYLIYLGVKLWRAPIDLGDQSTARRAELSAVSGPKMAVHAFAVTATNPKGIVFFVAFAPQFIDPTGAVAPQLAIMVATFVSMAAVNAGLVVLLADRLRQRVSRPGVMRWIQRGGGAALIGMGVAAAMTRRV